MFDSLFPLLFVYGFSGSGVSPFGRYPATFGGPNSAFPGLGTSVFPPPRDLPPLPALGPVHDPWSR